jgi:hypothetical protein
MEREDMNSDPRYNTQPARLSHGDEVDGIVAKWYPDTDLKTLDTSDIEKNFNTIKPGQLGL